MADREIGNFLKGVIGVVEATSFEKMCLWKEYADARKTPWRSRADGLLEQVGSLDGHPVCICLNTCEVDGHKLLFIEATSRVVDNELIRTWLRENLPPSALRHNGFLNMVDAMNFHNVFPR